MNYFRVIDSFDKKVVGKFPQLETGYFPVEINDPRLMLNIFFTPVDEHEVYTPIPKLVKRGKLTDFMHGTATGNIISDRLKNLIIETNPIGMQYIPQKIIVQNEEVGGYWLTNNYAFDYASIDYKMTEISVMKSTWDEDHRLKVTNAAEFESLVARTNLPQSIKIFRPYFIENYRSDFFALRYVYAGFSFFCSERFREKLEREGITGIRFMELDEVL